MFQAASNKARDFSAYYIAAWRLLFNPDKIYAGGSVPGDYPIYPKPATFKYTPAFLLIASPFLVLDYQTAMVAFNVLQFLLLPGIAFMIYRLLTGRNIALVSAIMVLVLVQPLPGLDSLFQNYRLGLLDAFVRTGNVTRVHDAFSWSYYRNWVDGNSKVLETFLILSSLYFGKVKKTNYSGFFFGLASFDPRWVLLAFPLTVIYNRDRLGRFLIVLVGTIVASNFLVIYHGIGINFVRSTIFSSQTPFYAYTWIPFYTIIAFTIINYREFFLLLKDLSKSQILPSRRLGTLNRM